jgi:hypothetical protein
MGYSISQEKILTKSKKNNNLTKLHTSHAASTTPTAAPTRITVGAFLLPVRNCVRFTARGNKRQWFVTSSQSRNHASQWTSHRAEITLRGPRSRNIKKRLYRRVEMSDKGKVKKIRRLGNTVTFLISNKLPNKLPPST